MGSRGPVPKRSSERRRRNADSKPSKVNAAGAVRAPVLPKATHTIARQWYNSLKRSGQSATFEPSDWAAALMVADQITRLMAASGLAIQQKDYRNIPIPASQFAALWSAMNDLLTTEAARRRVRLEIERPDAEEEAPPGVTALDDFRRRMEAQ